MVVPESEMLTQEDMESPSPGDQQLNRNHAFASLGRQSSIYSLTLDEFQHTLCESGKNFGSMNMDEFLNSIWTAEENQAVNLHPTSNGTTSANNNNNNSNVINGIHLSPRNEPSQEKPIVSQPSLPRQGSLTLPPPLCRKTVDEVWSEIHKSHQGQQQQNNIVQSSGSVPRQATFGEMTLEDFLIKAGIVREQNVPPAAPLQPQPPPPPPPPPPQYGLFQNNHNSAMGPTFVTGPPPIIGVGGGGATYQTLTKGGRVGESSAYTSNGKRNAVYPSAPVCYNGRMANGGGGGGGYGPGQGLVMEMSVRSPVSPDGMCTNQVEATNQYANMGGVRGSSRKRILDGPVEKVVERRQRRMIKNRESAARSRARKQAYTVELEAELNQLREENAYLKQSLAELEKKIKEEIIMKKYEEVEFREETKAQKANDKLRRTLSSPF
uniref:Abscisic acid-insensitive 5 n=1 Tax=Paeonia ostii var. lishizhenii TaxID=1821063 RepID=A0A974MYF0_9MAGN|nr:abscisic acid-insensitive 5 [Paeonia ostii var. lishizhenii]